MRKEDVFENVRKGYEEPRVRFSCSAVFEKRNYPKDLLPPIGRRSKCQRQK